MQSGYSHPERIPAAPHQPCAVVVADDRLRRLDDAVVDHEDDREDVAGDAVGGIVLSVVFASLIPSCRLFLESVKNKMQKKHFFFFLTP